MQPAASETPRLELLPPGAAEAKSSCAHRSRERSGIRPRSVAPGVGCAVFLGLRLHLAAEVLREVGAKRYALLVSAHPAANLNSQEQAELELLRTRQTNLLTITRPEEALRAKDEFQRVRARIREL